MNKKALLLHPLDNCVVALTDIGAGDLVEYEGGAVTATAAIALGHKAAIEDIPPGGKVRKYGAVIGSATAAIRRGDHIHTHNLASDYIAGFHH
jgi:altronate dehydratase